MTPKKTADLVEILVGGLVTVLITVLFAALFRLAFNSLADVHMTFGAAYVLLLVGRWVLDGARATTK